ncbi:hypothetical protein BK133_03715 [Paenibacillus sp. FSL H8-0548]|nr:hypothetical protein BK133_03715 [Paenibacillus sp. FSL H8-0548]
MLLCVVMTVKPEMSWASADFDGLPSAQLEGLRVVEAGQSFETFYVLPSSNEPMIAQDITITFDPKQVEFLGADYIRDGWIIAGQTQSQGEVRLLAASGSGNSFEYGDHDRLVLYWKAKLGMPASVPKIAIASMEGALGSESGLHLRSFTAAAAIQGDLNDDGLVTVGDLALVVTALGKSEVSPDWASYAKMDLNEDGTVDYYDLLMVAELILHGKITPASTTLTGPATASAGDTVELVFGINDLFQHIYAQDLILSFDDQTLEFIGAASINEERFHVLDSDVTSGAIRLLIVHMDTLFPSPSTQYVRLHFKVKSGTHSESTIVSVQSLIVANGLGEETDISGVAHTISFEMTNTEAGDLNGDHRISIGDLAILANGYGKSSTDADWSSVKQGDLNDDGFIDISDLSLLAAKILL